jgi:hypothetical protein
MADIMKHVGYDSSVDRATRYGLDVSEIESRWERDFLQLSIPDLGPTQSLVQRVVRLFDASKAAGEWIWPPTKLASRLKKEYIYTSALPLGLNDL